MNIDNNTKEIIEKTLQEIFELTNLDNTEYLHNAIFDIFIKHVALIKFLESDSEEIKERRKIKKEKHKYIPTYIKAFQQNKKFYKAIGDQYNYNEMDLSEKIFSLFLEDEEEFSRTLSQVTLKHYTYKLVDDKYKTLLQKHPSKLTKEELEIVARYSSINQLMKIFRFFQYIPLTKKVLETSLSISLFGLITEYAKIKKNPACNIIETMLYQLDIEVNLRLQEINYVYVKTIIDELPILAYPSQKDIASQVDHLGLVSIIKDMLSYHCLLPHEREAIDSLKDLTILKLLYVL